MLIALTGLPGVGKTMLAEALGIALPACVVSVDPIEAAMWRAGVPRSAPTGKAAYSVAGSIAESQLRLGGDVVVDAANTADEPRQMWAMLARGYGTPLQVVEVVCSDERLHRHRVVHRERLVGGFPLPTWDRVERVRESYSPWPGDRLVVDSAEDFETTVRTAVRRLGEGVAA